MQERQETTVGQETIKISGRVLYLTKDPALIRAQVDGADLKNVYPDQLRDFVSTDEIIPSWASMDFSDSENLGLHLLTGFSIEEKVNATGKTRLSQLIKPGELAGKFSVIVAGSSFGRGSSREHAQLALKGAGIQAVVAMSTERIFRENCTNYGIHTINLNSKDSSRLLEFGEVNLRELYLSNPVARDIVASGGLLPYTKLRVEGKIQNPDTNTSRRPMTIAEKIIARHSAKANGVGAIFVKPGDMLVTNIDTAYAYELQSDISQEVLESTFGYYAPVKPAKFYLFEDHLALMQADNIMAINHRTKQKVFADKYGIKLYSITEEGVEGICHTVMLEKHILPGDLVLGNDSHTCTGGAANALAIGKGASEFAGALVTEDIILKVPESIRFNLKGRLPEGVTSKDLMLYLLSLPSLKVDLAGSGRVFEFGGEGLEEMPFDDQIVLANMSIEGQAFTGIIEPNRNLIDFFRSMHGLSEAEIEDRLVFADTDAEYSDIIEVDLDQIERMVALPGDTQNGVPLSQIAEQPVNFAYLGSCTGGKLKDLREAASVLKGRKIAKDVKLKVQASSLSVLREARNEGLIQIIEEAGGEFILPGCGDCMGATSDASASSEVVISDTNRNFPGRMGRNRQVYLASPSTVAASAITGKITTPEALV